MANEKLKAGAAFNEEEQSVLVYVKIDGELLPVGRTVNKEFELFEYYKFESIEEAKDWVKEGNKFEYSEEIENELR